MKLTSVEPCAPLESLDPPPPLYPITRSPKKRVEAGALGVAPPRTEPNTSLLSNLARAAVLSAVAAQRGEL